MEAMQIKITLESILNALDGIAESFDQVRPSYPDRTIEWFFDELGVAQGRKVLEIYPRFGKLTSSFLKAGADVEAIEPGPKFRHLLTKDYPKLKVYDAHAELLPLNDSSVDIVTVSQAFHWCDPKKTIDEIHRVLRPGGAFGVLYTRRVHTDLIQKEVARIIKSHTINFNWRESDWRGKLAGTPRFSAGNQLSIGFQFECDEDKLVQHVKSIGFVGASPAQVQEEIEKELRLFVKANGDKVSLAYEAVALVCLRAEGTTLDDDGFQPRSLSTV